LRHKKYPRLGRRILLRRFEKPVAYNPIKDEIFELDEEAFNLLKSCNGTKSLEELLQEFREESKAVLEYALEEGLIEFSKGKIDVEVNQKLDPSLRYMLLHVTFRCNLECGHCYVNKKNLDMELETFRLILEEFDDAGGIKVMISGGEPLLHPKISLMLEELSSYDLRKVLITNGCFIEENLGKLEVDEVQLSLDGLSSHELIRGKGTLKKVLDSIRLLKNRGIEVSVATMIHRFNIDEFPDLDRLLKSLGVRAWMIDFPSTTNCDILSDFQQAAGIMREFGFGDVSHKGVGEFVCGTHLCSSDPEGNISRCGFFPPVGNIGEGLIECWRRLSERYRWRVNEIEKCKNCKALSECRGGCRFRALTFGNLLGPDPVMCELYLGGLKKTEPHNN
jgi:radical SAM protein with 4Fe4S-binding SPASM domain